MFQIQCLTDFLFKDFCLTCIPPTLCEKIRERKSEHRFKRPGKPSTPNVSPSSTGGKQGVEMPGWLFLSRPFLSGPGFVSVSCRVKTSAAVEASVYVWEQTRSSITSFLKAAGRRGGREIRSSSCQTALKPDFEPVPPHSKSHRFVQTFTFR